MRTTDGLRKLRRAAAWLLLAATALGLPPRTAAQETPEDAAAGSGADEQPIFALTSPEAGAASPQNAEHDFWTSPTLTGNWGGLRTALQDCGVTLGARETQFAFGVSGGIDTPVPSPLGPGNTFKYTGHGEYDALLNLEKLVGLPKGTLLIRLENWYGEYGNVSLYTGAFTPAVFPALLPTSPNDPGVPLLTNFLWTQPLSERLVVFAGKKDVLGTLDQDIFAGGDGTQQFVNQALVANPSFLLGLPYTSFTAGVVSPQEWGGCSAYVYDPTDRSQGGSEDPLDEGRRIGVS
jgi:porin